MRMQKLSLPSRKACETNGRLSTVAQRLVEMACAPSHPAALGGWSWSRLAFLPQKSEIAGADGIVLFKLGLASALMLLARAFVLLYDLPAVSVAAVAPLDIVGFEPAPCCTHVRHPRVLRHHCTSLSTGTRVGTRKEECF